MAMEELDFIKGFTRMCDDGWLQGWHERNGGNLTYRMTDEEVAEAHRTAAIHLHDLSMLTGYCAGWSLKQLIQENACAPAHSFCMMPRKFTIWLHSVDRWLAGEEVIFPGTPPRPSWMSCFKLQPAQ